MNLGDLATLICKKVRQRDTQALVDCKEFLTRRYELIYNESLWRDSLWTLEFTFTPEEQEKPESYDGIKFMPSVVDRLIALRTTDQPLNVVADEHLYRSALDEFTRTGLPVRYTTGAPVVAILPEAYPVGNHDISVVAGGAADTSDWNAVYIDADGNRKKSTGNLSQSHSYIATEDLRVLERLTKEVTEDDVRITTFAGDIDLLTWDADAEAFPARLPVRLLPSPTAATTFKALVKKKVIHLENDEDEPELRGVDNVLIPLVQGDMLERARQYGKAGLKFTEGLALLESFKTLHVHQETQQEQFVPEVGQISGISHGDFSTKGYWGSWS